MSSQQNVQTNEEFGRVRAALWPIHGYEMKKFLPMGLIMFLILFNYTILRDTKDVLIVTAPHSDSPVLGYLKFLFVLPAAFLFTVLYSKLTNVFSKQSLFIGIVVAFLIYFGAFAFVLYPNKEMIHMSTDWLLQQQEANVSLKWLYPALTYWTYSIFYMLSELWGSVMISLLFWQFANEIVRTKEAKRFYALFGLIANIALILSGTVVEYFSDIRKDLPADVDAWGVSLQYMMGSVVVCGLLCIAIYVWMNKNVLTDPFYYDKAEAEKNKSKKKNKPKLSMTESFKYILTSPYIGCIAVLVFSYGVTINLVEVVWKNQLKLLYPDPNDYGAFMGQFSKITGFVTMLLIFFTKGIVRRFGWLIGALVTPLVLAVTGGLFFAFVIFKDQLSPLVATLGVSTVFLASWIGLAQNVLTKGTKYSQFDPTKEMAYIPLDQELKTKGKAAVDVIGARLGKASGGATQLLFFSVLMPGATVLAVAPWLAVIVAVLVFAWLGAVKSLGRRYKEMVGDEESA